MKLFVLAFLLSLSVCIAKAQTYYVRMSTAKGDITLMLYDETPKHRDNFLKGIRNGTFKDAEFNRVIKGFVSQGGELDETIDTREKLHPELPVLRVDAEIEPNLFHKKGALGEGRNENPEKSSYVDQIYLVEGKIRTDAELDIIESKSGHKFTAAQREVYKTIGGNPKLDGDYTIFGEIVEGLAVAEAINSVQTHKTDVPDVPLKFTLHILSKQEIKNIIKQN